MTGCCAVMHEAVRKQHKTDALTTTLTSIPMLSLNRVTMHTISAYTTYVHQEEHCRTSQNAYCLKGGIGSRRNAFQSWCMSRQSLWAMVASSNRQHILQDHLGWLSYGTHVTEARCSSPSRWACTHEGFCNSPVHLPCGRRNSPTGFWVPGAGLIKVGCRRR